MQALKCSGELAIVLVLHHSMSAILTQKPTKHDPKGDLQQVLRWIEAQVSALFLSARVCQSMQNIKQAIEQKDNNYFMK